MTSITQADFEAAKSNDSMRSEIQRKILSIESQTIALMGELTALHTSSHIDDKSSALDMRSDLIARLTVAVTLP